MKIPLKHTGTWIVWVSVLIVLLALYASSFWYVKSKIEKASYHLSAAEVSYDQKDKVFDLIKSLEELEPEVQKIDSYFVGADDIVGFINLLEQKAREQNVSIETTNVSIDEEVELVYGEQLEVTLTVGGDWNDVMQYLNLVENMPYRINVVASTMSLEENEDASSEEDSGLVYFWEANITLQVLKNPSL